MKDKKKSLEDELGGENSDFSGFCALGAARHTLALSRVAADRVAFFVTITGKKCDAHHIPGKCDVVPHQKCDVVP